MKIPSLKRNFINFKSTFTKLLLSYILLRDNGKSLTDLYSAGFKHVYSPTITITSFRNLLISKHSDQFELIYD